MLLLTSSKTRRTLEVLVLALLILVPLRFLGSSVFHKWSSPPNTAPSKIYKKHSERPLAQRPFIAVPETFPLAANAKSPSDLPPIPSWNTPPSPHVPEPTPIFIGFTRNWSLLQQCIVSLITSGWPATDIYVVENTGTMDANQRGLLSPQNPFYLDHYRLTKVFGINVLTTPSLQTFAQLQNFYLYEAIRNNWPAYFWAHMDIIVQSSEISDPEQTETHGPAGNPQESKSYYLRALSHLRSSTSRSLSQTTPPHQSYRWALRYFAYDWITLMNTTTMIDLGGWDTMISYYTTDCDMYERMRMAGYETEVADAGPVYDVGSTLPDLLAFYRINDTRGSEQYFALQERLKNMQQDKLHKGERNRWQLQQMGGQGDKWYRDADGFVEALEIQVQAGIDVYGKKWGGVSGCALRDKGLSEGDAWVIKSVGG